MKSPESNLFPDLLIDWRAIDAPKFKKDWPGKLVRVTKFQRWNLSGQFTGPHMPPDGAVCKIVRRSNDYGGGSEFKIEMEWPCPACGYGHVNTIPESWFSEGKAEFVEADGIADYSHCLDDGRGAMLYLAAPYSNPAPAIRAEKAHEANLCAAWLMAYGFSVFSPLSMGHAIAFVAPDLQTDFAVWREPCLRMLEVSDALCVLMENGVQESVGVAAEIDHARKLGIPCNQITRTEYNLFEIVQNPSWWR